MKKCSNCFQTKPLDDFYVKRPSGHQSRCKACNTEVVAGYKARAHQKLFDQIQETTTGDSRDEIFQALHRQS